MRLSPFFTKSQRRALWTLEALLLAVIIGLSVRAWMVPETATGNKEEARTTHRRENITYATEETPVETFPFRSPSTPTLPTPPLCCASACRLGRCAASTATEHDTADTTSPKTSCACPA